MFESFDLSGFGMHLRKIRESLGYTQKDVENISGISSDALRRIETGKVLPRYDTIIYLSQTYKKDLLEDLKSYSNASELINYYYRLEYLIVNHDIKTLQDLDSDFTYYVQDENDIHQLVNVPVKKQFEFVLRGISKLYSYKLDECLDDFVTAMQVNNPTFDYTEFEKFKYTVFESRILILIASVLSTKKEFQSCNAILHFCLNQINDGFNATFNEKLLLTKIYVNLSYNYHRMDNHNMALAYATKGIDYCNKNYISYSLAALLYRKGIAEYLLEQSGYLQSLKSSINMLVIQGNSELAAEYRRITRENYGISIG